MKQKEQLKSILDSEDLTEIERKKIEICQEPGASNWLTALPLIPKFRIGVYKPPHVYCQMGFINTLPFPALHLSRNAAIVSESLKISDQRMAK